MEVKDLKKTEQASFFGKLERLGHEQVVFCQDAHTGLKAIIAIHDTTLGPALGGTRFWNYASEEDALTDVLRLSRGMTHKAAISGVNLGGGKAVIIGDPQVLKQEALLRRFGKFIDGLKGRYITAEDVNMNTADMEYIHMETKHVTGLPEAMGGSGNPSPVTAYGVYMGMKAAAQKAYGSDSLTGKIIGLQGTGSVGQQLVGMLVKEGASVFVTDLLQEKAENLAKQYQIRVVSGDKFFEQGMDIYSPCALGATLNDETIPQLKCDIIAGAANNQLKDEIRHGYMICDRGIIYAPDFLINAGGLINVYHEFIGNYNRKWVMEKTEKIYTSCLEILSLAEKENLSPHEAALTLVQKRLDQVGKIKIPM